MSERDAVMEGRYAELVKREAEYNDEKGMDEGVSLVSNKGSARAVREEGQLVRALWNMKAKVDNIFGEARISKEKRVDVEKEMEENIGMVESYQVKVEQGAGLAPGLINENVSVLDQKGIGTDEEWRRYVTTMERDGEMLAEICHMLNTNVSQLESSIAKLQEAARKGEAHEECRRVNSPEAGMENRQDHLLQENASSIGRRFATVWNPPCASPSTTEPAVDNAGALVSGQLATYLRSVACVDPEIFKGSKNENHGEFVRRFRRKYEAVVGCEATLVEILADDHIGGRAKNIFLSLPRMIKEQCFNAVVNEMARLLAHDSTAGRLRVLTELKNLIMRPNQEVAEFCVVLEELGRRPYPEGKREEGSLECAQILLDNLAGWPEHFQLVRALHKMEPRRAYEDVKQLALSIEQSKIILNARKTTVGAGE